MAPNSNIGMQSDANPNLEKIFASFFREIRIKQSSGNGEENSFHLGNSALDIFYQETELTSWVTRRGEAYIDAK